MNDTNLLSRSDYLFHIIEHKQNSVGDNLIPNGSFEIDSDNDLFPDEWNYYQTNQDIKAEMSEEEVKDGSKSLKVSINTETQKNNYSDGIISPLISVTPSTTYRLSAYIKVPNGYLSKGGSAVFWQSEIYREDPSKYVIHNFRLNEKSLILNDSMIIKTKFYLLPT